MRRPGFNPIIGLFLLSHFAGILAGLRFQGTVIAEGTSVVNKEPTSGLYMFAVIAITSLIMLAMIKYNITALIKLWFLSAVFMTSLIFFSAFFTAGIAISVTAAVFFYRTLTHDIWIRNTLDTLSYAGAGALFGTMIGPLPALIFLLLLGIYDIISVFFTKHMITLVKGGMDSHTFMGLMYPKDRHTSEKDVDLDAGNTDDPHDVDFEQAEKQQIGFVGGGDIIVPMIFAVSLIPYFGVMAAMFSSVGAALGLRFLFMKSKQGKFYPAIPAVGSGCLAGFLLYYGLTLLI